MSGFRTPYYNRAIGNTTEYSRPLYGDAADLFVDVDGDSWMDDLTGDGRTTRVDAHYLDKGVRRIPTEGKRRFGGGLGIYGSASHRGPFVHVASEVGRRGGDFFALDFGIEKRLLYLPTCSQLEPLPWRSESVHEY